MPPTLPQGPEIPTLRVRLGRRAAGTLTLLPGDRTLFAFDDGYLADPERPVLSLSFKDRFGGIVAEQAPSRVRVPPLHVHCAEIRSFPAEAARGSSPLPVRTSHRSIENEPGA